MSLTSSNDLLARIDRAVANDDDIALLSILERAHQAGELGNDEILLEAVVLLLPPFADYTRAHTVLKNLRGTSVEEAAAVWDGYRYVTVQPQDSSYMDVLEFYDSAEALYMRAQFHAYGGDVYSAIRRNNASIEKDACPNSLKLKLRIQSGLTAEERSHLTDKISRLVQIRNSEHSRICTAKELYALYWMELILGTAMSTVVWDKFRQEFGGKGVRINRL